MTFATDIEQLPFAPRQENATGFLPPIFRTIGHLLFVLSIIADENATATEDELLSELKHAKGHWDDVNANGTLSATTAEQIDHFNQALTSCITEFPDWDRDTRINNTRELANRTSSLAIALDRELLGLRNSDAGRQL